MSGIYVLTESGTRYRFVPQDDGQVQVYRAGQPLDAGWCGKDERIATLSVEQVGFIGMNYGKSMHVPLTEDGAVGGTVISTPVKEITLLDCPTWLTQAAF